MNFLGSQRKRLLITAMLAIQLLDSVVTRIAVSVTFDTTMTLLFGRTFREITFIVTFVLELTLLVQGSTLRHMMI
jgi:hypothetical protein